MRAVLLKAQRSSQAFKANVCNNRLHIIDERQKAVWTTLFLSGANDWKINRTLMEQHLHKPLNKFAS